ncbi:hypothetical protein B0H19DRAFT_1139456 [Mycena capillaripes]|nr:hypothetical protein B0H19DRAFT_1139456 [Mycena capillaripes]
MSEHSLPDEIISEILSPALKVSDEVFSDTSEVSPFASYSESTSAYLLVCKSWLRVATPLLYNVVILRSKAQAKALGLALSGNKQLGQFIKKLRVEGGYGPPMHIILRSSPNITDLFISFEIYSSDNTGGLCKGLPLINPTRLILRDFGYKRLENKMLTQLIDAVVESMLKWDRLCVFDCPYNGSIRASPFIPPLVKSKRLHTLIIPQASGLSWAYSEFKQCPLQIIRIKRPIWHWEQRYIPKADPALLALLEFSEQSPPGKNSAQDPTSELPSIAPSLNPSFIPLAGAAEEVYDAIWARILYFAMSVPELANGVAHRKIPRRLPLLLVSKKFNRLGLPHYYTYTTLKNSSAMSQIASILSKNPSIGPCIRGLSPRFGDSDDGWDSAESNSDIEDDVSEGDSMLTILSQTSGLVRLGAATSLWGDSYQIENAISWGAFETMSRCSGSTLRELSVRIKTSQKKVSATVFEDLTALRTLDWVCQTSFTSTDSPSDGLPSLEKLCISSASDSFFTALSLMKLESLRHVVLLTDTAAPEKFLKAHGHKLIELKLPYTILKTSNVEIFEVCLNLTSISLSIGYDTSLRTDDFKFDSPQGVPSLVKIILDTPFWSSNNKRIAAWNQFFLNFEPVRFPNLREMEVKCCVWPTSERDITKSCWVRWAEILLKRNISLTDKAGKKWRPRLKVK